MKILYENVSLRTLTTNILAGLVVLMKNLQSKQKRI